MRPITRLFSNILFLVFLAFPVLTWAAPMAESIRGIHLLNKLTFGIRPGDLEELDKTGVEAYIQKQLHPESIALPDEIQKQIANHKSVTQSPTQTFKDLVTIRKNDFSSKSKEDKKDAKKAFKQFTRQLLQEMMLLKINRMLTSPRQLEEVMADFWFNHFNVDSKKGSIGVLIGHYENEIRKHSLGKFRDLLDLTAHHPAMLLYLDNVLNTAPGTEPARKRKQGKKQKSTGINENYARELLELHTLGVGGGYTQNDVVALARILTGWTVALPRFSNGNSTTDSRGFFFNAARHDQGQKVLLGQTISSSGVKEGETALDLLAKHPSTAKFICRKLAIHFVSDSPPQSLIDRMSQTFTSTDGDIREVLKTLFASEEFWDQASYRAKFRTPIRYINAVLRATGKTIDKTIWFNKILNDWGMPLYGCQTPDGYETAKSKWLTPDAMVKRLSFATTLTQQKFAETAPIEAEQLLKNLNRIFSDETKKVIQDSGDRFDAALILGSPEMMYY